MVVVVKVECKITSGFHRLACILTNAKQEQNQRGEAICC
jgi:hypothetical protein